MNSCGISGPVTFNVAAGSYSGPVYVGAVIGASATNTVTFNGGDASTTTLSHDGTNQNAVVMLDGALYVTFKNFTI